MELQLLLLLLLRLVLYGSEVVLGCVCFSVLLVVDCSLHFVQTSVGCCCGGVSDGSG